MRYPIFSNTGRANLAGFVICASLLGAALFFQKMQGLDPCPLCMAQRLAVGLTGFLFLLVVLHRPVSLIGSRVYLGLLTASCGLGFALTGRHLWLQSLPADEVPLCGPSLEYMVQYFPMSDVLEHLLHGAGSCAEVNWTFLSFSMPFWVMIWFFILLGIAWFANFRPRI